MLTQIPLIPIPEGSNSEFPPLSLQLALPLQREGDL